MGVHQESSGVTLLTGGLDPQGRPLQVSRVNGIRAFAGRDFALEGGLGGSVQVTAAGVVTFDDSGVALPGAGQTAPAGNFTYRLGNGDAESATYEVQVELTGEAATASFPASAFMAFDTTEVVVDGSNKVSQWTDQTGNGHHLVQANPALQPELSNDGFGVPRIYQDGPSFQHLQIPTAGIPKDTPFQAIFAFREDANQRGNLIANRDQFQHLGIWWENLQGTTPMQVGGTTFLEAHTGGQVLVPGTPKGQFGEAHRNGNIVLLRDLVIDTSQGYRWDDMLLLTAYDPAVSATLGAYNLTGGIYAVAFFTNWSEAAQAEAWAVSRIQTNRAPLAVDLTLSFDAGALQ